MPLNYTVYPSHAISIVITHYIMNNSINFIRLGKFIINLIRSFIFFGNGIIYLNSDCKLAFIGFK